MTPRGGGARAWLASAPAVRRGERGAATRARSSGCCSCTLRWRLCWRRRWPIGRVLIALPLIVTTDVFVGPAFPCPVRASARVVAASSSGILGVAFTNSVSLVAAVTATVLGLLRVR